MTKALITNALMTNALASVELMTKALVSVWLMTKALALGGIDNERVGLGRVDDKGVVEAVVDNKGIGFEPGVEVLAPPHRFGRGHALVGVEGDGTGLAFGWSRIAIKLLNEYRDRIDGRLRHVHHLGGAREREECPLHIDLCV